MGQILNENLDFWCHLSTFGAKRIPKIWPFKTEKDALTRRPKQPQNNFKNVKKTTFLTPKIAKSRM